MCRARQFVYGLSVRKLREVGAAYLDETLDVLGRNASFQDCHSFQSLLSSRKPRFAWQVAQTITALRILLVEEVGLKWAVAVWD